MGVDGATAWVRVSTVAIGSDAAVGAAVDAVLRQVRSTGARRLVLEPDAVDDRRVIDAVAAEAGGLDVIVVPPLRVTNSLGRRLERLVDEVLLFTAGRFGLSGYDLEPVEVAPILAQSLAASEANLRDEGFTVSKELDEKLPLIVADPAAAITCIENLVSNAMKYSNSSKWIAIRAVQSSVDSRPEVRISVEDKGIGIASSDLAHVFEPFYRVQSVRDNQIRGVGLGLYLVKRMMEDMGGRVSVRSELGRGTEVALHFPAAEAAEYAEKMERNRNV